MKTRTRGLATATVLALLALGLNPVAHAAVAPSVVFPSAEPTSNAGQGPDVGAAAPAPARGNHTRVIWGTDGNDVRIGTDSPEIFHMLPGDDLADGMGGNDWIAGNAGRDHLIGGPGQDIVRGGGGNDVIDVADGEVDHVRCGGGYFDQVIADMSLDVVSSDCERVVPASKGQATIVQLGDSVAAGEGTLYGFTWDPVNLQWNPPTDPNPTWSGPYPECHQSPYAYGNVIAADLNANFTNFACTGATYAAGIAGPQPKPGVPAPGVPAQFQQLADSGIKPDLVIVTIGANDVDFSGMLLSCIISAMFNPSDPECTATNVGSTINTDFWTPVNNGTIRQNWLDTVAWLRNQFGGPRRLQIVFTSYYSPLERGTPNGACKFDPYVDPIHAGDSVLTATQNSYLGSLMNTLKSQLVEAVGYTPSVSIVDIGSFVSGHTWCTQDPWAYGPGTQIAAGMSTPTNPSGVHPTPEGQQAIAGLVEPQVVQSLSR